MPENKISFAIADRELIRQDANDLLQWFNDINTGVVLAQWITLQVVEPGTGYITECAFELTPDNNAEVCELLQKIVERKMVAVHTMEDKKPLSIGGGMEPPYKI